MKNFKKYFSYTEYYYILRNIFRRSNAKTNKKSVYQNIEDFLFIELETIKDYSVSISHHLM